MPALTLAFGALFGFLLSRARATDYDAILGMFRLQDLHLMGVIGSAVATAALGLFLLRRSRARALTGGEIALTPKPMQPRLFLAGLVFGAGWALTGACPGTALAQIGEGKLYALFTTAGILAGTWLYGFVKETRSAPAPATSPKGGESWNGSC